MSGSLGHPGDYNRKEVKESIEKLEIICKEQKFPLGFHVVPPEIDIIKNTVDKGYSFIAVSTDFLFMASKANSIMNQLKIV